MHEDVDECNVGDATCCEHLCINTPGSHTCTCHLGFTLADDGCRCQGLPALPFYLHAISHNWLSAVYLPGAGHSASAKTTYYEIPGNLAKFAEKLGEAGNRR